MPIVKVNIYPEYEVMYRSAGYPLGKSTRGFKKWLKRRMKLALKAWVNESNK